MIEIDEGAWPRWLHDDAAEAKLDPLQRWVVKALYIAYKGIQNAMKMEREVKERLAQVRKAKEAEKWDQDAARMHAQWAKDAAQAEQKLRESDPRLQKVGRR
jgi:hypothetical protein